MDGPVSIQLNLFNISSCYEGGHFKEQLWCTIHTIALTFLLISGGKALIEDRGIRKGILPRISFGSVVQCRGNSIPGKQLHSVLYSAGLGLHEEVQSSIGSNTKFSNVKLVNKAEAKLEGIMHYLRDPKVQ